MVRLRACVVADARLLCRVNGGGDRRNAWRSDAVVDPEENVNDAEFRPGELLKRWN